MAEQNRLTEAYLQRQPIRSYFQSRIQKLWNFRKTELPIVEGGRVFYRMNSGLQLQSPLYMRDDLTAPAVLLIDPNVIWPDGKTSLAAFEPAPATAQHGLPRRSPRRRRGPRLNTIQHGTGLVAYAYA